MPTKALKMNKSTPFPDLLIGKIEDKPSLKKWYNDLYTNIYFLLDVERDYELADGWSLEDLQDMMDIGCDLIYVKVRK